MWWLALLFGEGNAGVPDADPIIKPWIFSNCDHLIKSHYNCDCHPTMICLGQIRGDTCSGRKKQRCWPRISTQAFCARSLRKLDSTGRSVLCGRKQRVWGLYKNWGLQCSLVFEDVVTTPERVSLGGSCSLITTSRQVSWLLWPSVPLSVKWEF